ncbi:MAG: VIT domain-containing protein, partial [Fimbriimonadaceae bacterium]
MQLTTLANVRDMGGRNMYRSFGLAILALAMTGAYAQDLSRVYNRDSGESFKLKSASTKTRVMGPLFKQETIFKFENPYKNLTEASVWFDLNEGSVLSDFSYWYKDEFVPGVLMDKNKAWFIYTAITSRNEDPGIMVQTSPSSYHAQIYPLAVGYDLRVQLGQIGFLIPEKDGLTVPNPSSFQEVKPSFEASSWQPELLDQSGDTTKVNVAADKPLDLQVYAQRHKDGYTYVAGLIRRETEEQAITLSGLSRV